VWLLTPNRTRQLGQHWTAPGPYRARNDRLFCFVDEFKGATRANYPQLSKGMNSSRRLWLLSWWWTYSVFPTYSVEAQAPGVQGYALIRSEIISHFWPVAGTVRFVVTPVNFRTEIINTFCCWYIFIIILIKCISSAGKENSVFKERNECLVAREEIWQKINFHLFAIWTRLPV